MSVNINDVEYIARLAKLEFSDEEKDKFTSQFNNILKYMKHLNSVETTDIEPLLQVNELHNVFRDDIVKPSTTTDEALKNSPLTKESHFKVPKVIG